MHPIMIFAQPTENSPRVSLSPSDSRTEPTGASLSLSTLCELPPTLTPSSVSPRSFLHHTHISDLSHSLMCALHMYSSYVSILDQARSRCHLQNCRKPRTFRINHIHLPLSSSLHIDVLSLPIRQFFLRTCTSFCEVEPEDQTTPLSMSSRRPLR